jgi:hypothetical protein
MRRILFTAVAVGAMSASAVAQSARPDLYAMSCNSASAMVNARGAVIGNTGPNTYARIVSNAGFCPKNEQAIPLFSRSSDQPQCMVGYECRDITAWESR